MFRCSAIYLKCETRLSRPFSKKNALPAMKGLAAFTLNPTTLYPT